MYWLCVVFVSAVASATASSRQLQQVENPNIAKTFGVMSAELRDSFLYPVLLNPLQINKLTCGSVLTIFDNSSEDITVAADVCLITLLIGKLMVLLPMILENLNLDLENGVFGVIGNFQEGVNKVQSGVDNKLAVLEKPIEALAGFPANLAYLAGDSSQSGPASYSPQQSSYNAPQASGHHGSHHGGHHANMRKTDTGYDYVEFESRKDTENEVDYVDLSEIKEEDLADYYNLPRSFQVAKLDNDLQSLLHQLEGAISITRN